MALIRISIQELYRASGKGTKSLGWELTFFNDDGTIVSERYRSQKEATDEAERLALFHEAELEHRSRGGESSSMSAQQLSARLNRGKSCSRCDLSNPLGSIACYNCKEPFPQRSPKSPC